VTAHDRTPAPPLDETDLQAIEQGIEANLAVARERYPDATDDQIHTAIHHCDALALVVALRAAWRENARYRALLTRARYGIDSWSTVDLDRLIDEIDAALAAPGAGGEATEERTT
jgi:hypothetical protein